MTSNFTARGCVLRAGGPPAVMGILNVTPDSFHDGGRHADPAAAVDRAQQMRAQGAALIDLGGESTRPGAAPVDEAEELRRVLPVAEQLGRAGIPFSIDTVKPEVARAALDCGALLVNDISGLRDGDTLARLAAQYGAGLCLMHMQGEPRTMQQDPQYADVVAEVGELLAAAAARARAAGVAADGICVDPGIGFGKTVAHNVALLRALPVLAARTQCPVLVGLSRKSFLGRLLGAMDADRLGATVAANLFAARRGAALLRVHDVRETVQALRITAALTAEGEG